MNPKPWLEECCFWNGRDGGFVFKLWEKLPHTAGQRNVYLITFCLLSLQLSHVNSHLTDRERERERLRGAEREGEALHQCAGKEECGFTAVKCLKPMWKERERGEAVLFIQSHSFRRVPLMTPVQTHSFYYFRSIWKSLSLQKTTGGNVAHRWAALHALTPITSSTWHNINTLVLAAHTQTLSEPLNMTSSLN